MPQMMSLQSKVIQTPRVIEVMKSLKGQLTPGTCIEGIWDAEQGRFYASDITFKGVRPPKITVEIRDGSNSSRSTEVLQLVTFRDSLPSRTQQRRLRMENITGTLPSLPLDDYWVERFQTGIRTHIQEPVDEPYKAMDLRHVAFEDRRKLVEKIVDKLGHPDVDMTYMGQSSLQGHMRHWVAQGDRWVLVRRRLAMYGESDSPQQG